MSVLSRVVSVLRIGKGRFAERRTHMDIYADSLSLRQGVRIAIDVLRGVNVYRRNRAPVRRHLGYPVAVFKVNLVKAVLSIAERHAAERQATDIVINLRVDVPA